MYLISHRGNIDDPCPSMENSPSYIMAAVDSGFDVEVDVWKVDDLIYLGHDQPQYLIDLSFLNNERFYMG